MLAERGIILAAIDKAIAEKEEGREPPQASAVAAPVQSQYPQEDVQKVLQANPSFNEQDAQEYLTYLKGVGGYTQ